MLESVNYTDLEQLLSLEYSHIKRNHGLGDKLLNKNHRDEEAVLDYKPYNVVDIEVNDDNKYKIHNDGKGMLNICFDNKKKVFRYGRQPYDTVFQKALDYRLMLLRKEKHIDF